MNVFLTPDIHPIFALTYAPGYGMGLTRAGLLKGKGFRPEVYRQPYHADFYNLAAMLRNGLFHLYTTKKVVNWNKLPSNSLQMRGKPETDCYRGVCRSVSLKK